MAKKKFTQLPVASSLSGDEILAVVQGGISKQTTASQLTVAGSTPFVRWNFATSGASPGDYPTDLTKIYISVDDSVLFENTWFVSDGSGGWYTK